MYSVSKEYKHNIVDYRLSLALSSLLKFIRNEGIMCSRQLDNIVESIALWDMWFNLLWSGHGIKQPYWESSNET